MSFKRDPSFYSTLHPHYGPKQCSAHDSIGAIMPSSQ